ncbi:histidinol-phosphatase (PHP family) [Butyrivibrio proteoclasticus]|uniref:Histidinol-phosphatase n=1 Tax=Butyrivibrio proteoclasticus TaxID=43305 RepID=A0A1I5RN88_9FIRM|nr:histidinol-phosphatase HisJ family protein [Butyrivibrio proteoclasticus]SFP60009.1 histidinol-phosphatase (PHP family) [Butyrivibrio proteoclasticus]
MNNFLPPDYHMHTHNSGDSTAPMEEMILSSIKRGLNEICFTEHLDLNYPLLPDLPPNVFDLDIKAYRNEFLYYSKKYSDRITLNFGVEIGMQNDCVQENLSFVRDNNFDFVIASQHLLDKKDPFYPNFWEGGSIENIFKKYFEETLENVKGFTDFDVLGHIDYIARYVPDGDTSYSYSKYSDIIDAILEYLIKNDKGLDLNSKVLAYEDKTLLPNPCPEIIKRYKELGGKIITFGSDAHTPERVATHFEEMTELAKKSGFTEYYTFKKRVPTVHKLL